MIPPPPVTTVWVDVDTLTDQQMAHHANRRRRVKLDDGRIAVLVGWPVPGYLKATPGRTCRIEWMSGNRVRVHTRRVRQVAIPRIT